VILGRDIAQMTPEERLAALAEFIAVGCEKLFKQQRNELAQVRKAMAPCKRTVNGRRPHQDTNQ
jgi:hypothetical protein